MSISLFQKKKVWILLRQVRGTWRLVWSARFHVPKNGTSSAPIYERSPKTSRNTPQNGWVDIWVMRFHFRASIKPIFENHVFRAVWSPFYPLKRPKNENGLPRIVYGSINLKIVFWGLHTNLQVPRTWRSKIQTFFFLEQAIGHNLLERTQYNTHILGLKENNKRKWNVLSYVGRKVHDQNKCNFSGGIAV